MLAAEATAAAELPVEIIVSVFPQFSATPSYLTRPISSHCQIGSIHAPACPFLVLTQLFETLTRYVRVEAPAPARPGAPVKGSEEDRRVELEMRRFQEQNRRHGVKLDKQAQEARDARSGERERGVGGTTRPGKKTGEEGEEGGGREMGEVDLSSATSAWCPRCSHSMARLSVCASLLQLGSEWEGRGRRESVDSDSGKTDHCRSF